MEFGKGNFEKAANLVKLTRQAVNYLEEARLNMFKLRKSHFHKKNIKEAGMFAGCSSPFFGRHKYIPCEMSHIKV